MDAAVARLAEQTLAEVVEAGRVVTRVAVTVRTSTFYTRTKIRKLPAASVDAALVTATALEVLAMFDLDRPIRLLGVRLALAMPEPVVTANP
jgi:DNA polymerase-4